MDELRYFYRILNRQLPIKPLFLLFIGTFLIILPIICVNLQYSSYFYPGDLNYAGYLARRRDEVRMAHAETYIAKMTREKQVPYEYARGIAEPAGKEPRAPKAPTISLVITAVNRNTHEIDQFEPHYLTQSVHAMLRALDWDVKTYGRRWHRLNVSVCNVDQYPDKFGEAEHVGRLVRVFQRQHPFKIGNPVCKEKEDFAFCLSRVAVREENEFIVIVEDDMLARIDAMDALWKLVDTHLPRRFKTREAVQKRLGAVHLHTPMKNLHYSFSDSTTWLELMLMSAGGTFFLFCIYFRVYFRPYHNWSNLCLFGSLACYCSLVALLVGRPHLLNARHSITRHYSLTDAPGPNFSVVLFPTDLVQELSAFVQRAECSNEFNKAGAVTKFIEYNNRRNLAFYPSLFQHVGLYSVYRKDTVYPYDLDA